MTVDPGQELPQNCHDTPSTYSFAYGYVMAIISGYLQGDLSREMFARCVADIDVTVQANLNRISMQCYDAGLQAARRKADRQL